MNKLESTGCLRYWDLCPTLTIEAAVSLWCDVEPTELQSINISTLCMDAKREAIISALRDGRLAYEEMPVPRNDGKDPWYTEKILELIDKDGVRIKKDSLRRWFMEVPIADRPAFLFDEARQDDALPDGGEVAEMNTMLALAVMASMLARNKSEYKIGDRPNANEIGKAIETLAKKFFGEEVRGFSSFHKKISKALKLLEEHSGINKPLW